MIDIYDTSTSELHRIVVWALREWKTEDILGLLSDGNSFVRTSAARELHMRGEKIAFDKAKELLKDKRSFVREIAVFTLAQLGTPDYPYKEESIPLVAPCLNDSSAMVRAAAAAALSFLCSKTTMPLHIEQQLIQRANDKDAGVRDCVAIALGSSSGSPQVRHTLHKLLKDKNKNVREGAEVGLANLDGVYLE